MGSTWIKQNSSINEINWECTCDNGIGCLSILLGESEDSSLSSTSLLTSRRLTKTSHTTSTTPPTRPQTMKYSSAELATIDKELELHLQ